ncbi:hypothetical protein Fmac_015616 [Flemingia macrophylla]|uniref:Uncharacterized protein n=1 Tax=Flemingia macrophylla TaxID=520843 RepID=A0ABD1MF28_9FABA
MVRDPQELTKVPADQTKAGLTDRIRDGLTSQGRFNFSSPNIVLIIKYPQNAQFIMLSIIVFFRVKQGLVLNKAYMAASNRKGWLDLPIKKDLEGSLHI